MGTPIALTGTHADFMVVIDILSLMTGLNSEGVMVHFDMLNTDMDGGVHLEYDVAGDFHYGYFSSGTGTEAQGFSPVLINYFHEGEIKIIDLSSCVAGKVYHYITDFGATTTLDIPNMEEEIIIVP